MNEDTEAQEAIRNTLKDQADQEIRSHAQNVLIEASRRLKTYGTADDADQRIMQAISEMQNHGGFTHQVSHGKPGSFYKLPGAPFMTVSSSCPSRSLSP